MLSNDLKKSLVLSLQEELKDSEKDVIEITQNINGKTQVTKLRYTISIIEYLCIDPKGKKYLDHKPFKEYGMNVFMCKNCGVECPKPLKPTS